MPRDLTEERTARNVGEALRVFLAAHPEGVEERVVSRAMVEIAQVRPEVYNGVLKLYLTTGWISRDGTRLKCAVGQ